MEYFDGVEVCEFVGAYILSQLNNVLEIENVGLLLENVLGIFKNLSGSEIVRKRKAILHVLK